MLPTTETRELGKGMEELERGREELERERLAFTEVAMQVGRERADLEVSDFLCFFFSLLCLGMDVEWWKGGNWMLTRYVMWDL